MTSWSHSYWNDVRTLWQLLATRAQGDTHAQRLESFYSRQAQNYDVFRRRLLHGRQKLIDALTLPENGIWVDFGAGTGENAERFGDRLSALRQAYLVDLCPSLLQVARQRIASCGWKNVVTVEGDATSWRPPTGPVDVVTFSYSLTMIPNWFEAIDHAASLLKPGGLIGITDFFVSRKHVSSGQSRHGWLMRHGWPAWFAGDNVFLSADHLPYLRSRFTEQTRHELLGPLPYVPLARVPYYVFVGKKELSHGA